MNSVDPGSLVDEQCSVQTPGELVMKTTEQELAAKKLDVHLFIGA